MNSASVLRHRRGAASVVMLAVLLGGCSSDLTQRREQVADRGAEVMPFDLERTTHRWMPMPDGLEQIVAVDDPYDTEQVVLVREHLRLEAARFRRGDFQDPATIHGRDMPGLALLREHDGRIDITFEESAEGGIVRFVTQDPGLVDALHAWAQAQLTDHGPHAESG